ncbi:hypothetical protein L3Q82_022114 [Scortum barcoo]|uniref:Uncharacterized protein n=1 Tax=Scortum barcoo TaxID=214431 RepID=A0ACB8X0D0_9TELE|nr:hypothetical protein L3Q82_022114 [Scortum barcoo]
MFSLRVSISAHGTRTPLGRRSMIDFVVVSSDLRPYVLDTLGFRGRLETLSPEWTMFSASIVDAGSSKLWTQGLWCLSWWQSPNPVVDTGSTGRPSKPQPGRSWRQKLVWEEFVGGELLTSTEDIVGRWKKYFEDLLNPTDLPSNEEAEDGDSEVDSSITQAEVTEGAVLADTPLQHCMEVGDSTSGVANWGWWSLFLKRGPESVFQLQRDHFSASPGRSTPGYWRGEFGDSRPSDSGGTMRFSSLVEVEQWTSSIPSAGCLRVYGSLPNQSTCALWIWRRHSTVSLVVFCGSAPISRRSQGPEGVRFGNHRISSLLFADDVVLLASSSQDLQHVLERFAAECEAAGMRISTSKSEAMVLDRKRVVCPLRVSGEVLPQVEEFKYLGVLFTSEGKMEREIDRRIGAASAVMRSDVPDRRGEEGAESKGEALDLPVNLHVPPHLWS